MLNRREDKTNVGTNNESNSISQSILDFLAETEPFLEKVDELPPETAVELYDMYGILAQTATENIAIIDPEIRVTICNRQDMILERVIDVTPPMSFKDKKIFTPAVQGYRRWKNIELMKDKGLAGYMLANEIGAHSVMYFGTKPSDYPNLSDLPGMDMLYQETGSGTPDAYLEHIIASYPEMDTLMLHGMYEQTIGYLDAYRKLRPDGKVFCGLDMNSYWMRNIQWSSAAARNFATQCDVIATSCRPLRDALNRKTSVHFPCHWFPNGFYNPTGVEVIADPEQKENTIMTVGRIGTPDKNNAELLVAFARVSNALPGWSLRLVGPVETKFQPLIEHYFSERPDLEDRVVFTGAIMNKGELYKEYAKGKVFALTSPSEGGTPNVYAEALFHGCMFITSDIDGADDITNFGELGIVYKLGDIDALSSALVKMCSNANKTALQKHIPKALAYATKYYDWNRNAKKLAYMLYGVQET